MADLSHVAVGTWSGGRFMHFGEELSDERLEALLRPGGGIDTVLTADTYGQGEADRVLGRALTGVDRGSYALVGAVGHDFYEGERDGPRGFPRFTDPRLRGEGDYASYLRMATERSLERIGADAFDLLLLHNPDRIGYTSEAVWDGMAALREAGLTRLIGVAPGPANGFTLDVAGCLERFGDRIDWAMIILNPLEPWPGELVLPAAAAAGVRVIARVADYGGLFHDDVLDGHEFRPRRPPHVPPRGLGRGRPRADGPDAARRRAPRALDAAARMCLGPRPRCRRVRRADADPGGRRRRAGGRGQAGGPRGDAERPGAERRRRRTRSARSATTTGAWRSRAGCRTSRASRARTAGRSRTTSSRSRGAGGSTPSAISRRPDQPAQTAEPAACRPPSASSSNHTVVLSERDQPQLAESCSTR